MSTASFHSATIPQERLLPGIHGLRGIAAMAVVLFHLVHLANISVPKYFSFIGADFGKGVHLFFVISAFSLMHSTEHTMHRQTWASEYFIKRFFRIAPLYYCIMAAMVLWPVIKSQKLAVSIEALLLNLTFMFGFAPWTGIVWAGWTVGVEMLFYAVLPVLLLTIRTTLATFVLFVISIIVTLAAYPALHEHYEMSASRYGYNWAYFSIAANLCFFAMGMYVFRLKRTMDNASLMMRWLIPAFSVVLLGSLIFAKPGSQTIPWNGATILWGIGFATLCLWQSTHPSRWSANRIFEYLGERSYSIYLLHPMVIMLLKQPIQNIYAALTPHFGAYAFFVCAVLLLLPLLALTEATYRLIEIPGMGLGKKINSLIRNRATTYGSSSPV